MPKLDDIQTKKPFQKKTRRAWDMLDPLTKFADKPHLESDSSSQSIESMDSIKNMVSIENVDTINSMDSIENMDTINSMEPEKGYRTIESMGSINSMVDNNPSSLDKKNIAKKSFIKERNQHLNNMSIESMDTIKNMDTTGSMDTIYSMVSIENMESIELMDRQQPTDDLMVSASFLQNLTALDLSARELRVLLHISYLSSCKPDNYVWITNAQFENELKISPKTLYLTMGALLDKKLIHRKLESRPNKNFYALSRLLFLRSAKRAPK